MIKGVLGLIVVAFVLFGGLDRVLTWIFGGVRSTADKVREDLEKQLREAAK